MMGTVWALNSWALNLWTDGSWAAQVIPYHQDGLYMIINLGGGVVYLKSLS